jgi:hypothetical protein
MAVGSLDVVAWSCPPTTGCLVVPTHDALSGTAHDGTHPARFHISDQLRALTAFTGHQFIGSVVAAGQ